MLLVCLVVAACGKSKSSEPAASGSSEATAPAEPASGHCWMEKFQTCWDFPDDGHALVGMCSDRDYKKLVANQPCPSENLVGTCRGKSLITKYYGGPVEPPWTPETMAADCKELGGTLQ